MLSHCDPCCPANQLGLMLYNVEDQSRVWFSVVQVVLCGLAQCLLSWDCALIRSGCSRLCQNGGFLVRAMVEEPSSI